MVISDVPTIILHKSRRGYGHNLLALARTITSKPCYVALFTCIACQRPTKRRIQILPTSRVVYRGCNGFQFCILSLNSSSISPLFVSALLGGNGGPEESSDLIVRADA